MAQMEKQSSKNRTKWWSRANLSDAEFKTLVIRMLTEMVKYGRKIEEKVKAMKSELKENAHGTNSDRKETGTQINGSEQKEEKHSTRTEWRSKNFFF